MKNTSLILILFILILICLTSKTEDYGFGYYNNFSNLVSSLFNRQPKLTDEYESAGGVQEIKMGNIVLGQKRWYMDEDGNIGEYDYSPNPMASMWGETPLLSAHHKTDYNPQFARPVDQTSSTNLWKLQLQPLHQELMSKQKAFDNLEYQDLITRTAAKKNSRDLAAMDKIMRGSTPPRIIPASSVTGTGTGTGSGSGSIFNSFNNVQNQIQNALNNPQVQDALAKYKARQN